MNPFAKSISKPLELVSFGPITLESWEWYERLFSEGRGDRLGYESGQLGGACVHALRGARLLDPRARLGIVGVSGELDQSSVRNGLDELALDAVVLLAAPGTLTNRSRVGMDNDGQSQIVRIRRDATAEAAVDQINWSIVRNRISNGRAAVIGNTGVEMASALCSWGRHTGTYVALCAGDRQLAHLDHVAPHALFLNREEACEATGQKSEDDDVIFRTLCDQVRVEHLVVMTTGKGPIYLSEQFSGRSWILPPVDVSAASTRRQRLCPIGAGGVLAGLATALLGRARQLITGDILADIIQLGQAAAVIHLTGGTTHSIASAMLQYRMLAARIDAVAAAGKNDDRAA